MSGASPWDTSKNNMNLTITAEGPVTSHGRIPLAELARIASSFQATLERIAISISGMNRGRGRRPREIVDAVSLDFVGFRAGSAILEMKRSGQVAAFNDLLEESIDAFREGINSLNDGAIVAPDHFTPLVLKGLRDLTGGLGPGGLTKIEFSAGQRRICAVDRNFRSALHRVEAAAIDQPAIIVGRLLMGDFSPASLRCRIDTFAGSVLCDFDAQLRDVVLDSMDLLVKAQGLAELQPDGSTIRLLHLEALDVVRETRMRTLDGLAREQGIAPVRDITELQGEPIEDFDGFLEAVRSARHG